MRIAVVACALVALTAGQALAAGSGVYTLYRSSPFDKTAKIHVATFDAGDVGADYNIENCRITAKRVTDSLPKDPLTGLGKVTYWCEEGRAPNALK